MKSNVRRTFRPTLEALEGRLVPSFSWGEVSSPDFAAVLTAAQPAPALSSFQWGIGRGVSAAMISGWSMSSGGNAAAVPTPAQPTAASPPALGLMTLDGPTTVVTPALHCSGSFCKVEAPTMRAGFSEIVVTKTHDDIVLHRVPDLTTQTGPTTVVTAAPSIILKRVGGDARPVESVSL
jgi:hypothetical protein